MRHLLAGLLLVGLLLPPARAAGAGTVLVLSPQPVQVAPGERVKLTAAVQDVANLYAVEVHLRFDPALLQVVPAGTDAATPASELLKPDFVAANRFDNAAGSVDFAFTQISPSEPVSGSGPLMTVTFSAVGAGNAAVNVESFILSDIDGMALPAQSSHAQITIGGRTASEPTGTPPAPATAVASPAGPSASPVPEASPAATAPVAAAAAAAAGNPTGAVPEPERSQAATPAPLSVVATPTPDRPALASGAPEAPQEPAAAQAPARPVLTPGAEDVAPTAAPAVVSAATPAPQRMAAAPAQPAALAKPPARVDVDADQRGQVPPVWLLIAGIGLLSIALALATLLLFGRGGGSTGKRLP